MIYIKLTTLLFAAHIIGDFWLQTDLIVRKSKNNIFWLLIHTTIIGLTSWLIAGDLDNFLIFGTTFLAHTIIDGGKWYYKRRNHRKNTSNSVRLIIFDQILHIISIIMIILIIQNYSNYTCYWLDIFGKVYLQLIILVSGLILAIRAAGFLIDRHLSNFKFDQDSQLKEGGQTIGRLERLLIFIFILVGIPEALGFLIAAKSIFRIGELREPEHRRQAEYIMIGTLYSFTYAIVFAYATRYLINYFQ